MSWRMSLLRGVSQATSLIITRLQKPALRYDRTQKQQGACQGMVLSSGGSCQTPICTEGTASCMMQTGVWEVEDEKNLNQRCEWQKLKRWGQAQFSGESILPGELKQSQTSCNMLLSKKNQFIQAPQLTFLKSTKQQVLPQAMQANTLFVKAAQRLSLIHYAKTFLRWGRKLVCH